jgi:2-methylisocitrate lyase-like PEP mutase family enzyme
MLASRDYFERAIALQQGFFLLPDVGDLMGAVLMQDAGFPAIGTTSVGLGFVHGCPATHAVSRQVMLESVDMIVRAIKVPLFVDLEQGYADTPSGVGDVAREVLRAGAVGFNIEDSDGIPGAPLRSAEAHAERIAAARAAADREGVPALITGRTDLFWLNTDMSEEEKTEEAIRRANLYLEAGADSIFISGRKAVPAAILKRLVAEIKGQLNSLLSAGGPSVADYRDLGIKRLQTGSLAVRAQSGFVREGFRQLLETNDTALLDRYAVPTPQLNTLVTSYWNK